MTLIVGVILRDKLQSCKNENVAKQEHKEVDQIKQTCVDGLYQKSELLKNYQTVEGFDENQQYHYTSEVSFCCCSCIPLILIVKCLESQSIHNRENISNNRTNPEFTLEQADSIPYHNDNLLHNNHDSQDNLQRLKCLGCDSENNDYCLYNVNQAH